MRAIRGNGCSPIRSSPNEPDMTKQPPQLSDHLKSLLARQGNGGDFGSLISPIPASKPTVGAGGGNNHPTTVGGGGGGGGATNYHHSWAPYQFYQQTSEIPIGSGGYLEGMNRIDYCTTLREHMTWSPLPLPPPSVSPSSTTAASAISSSHHNTPTTQQGAAGNGSSPERSSTVSSTSSGLSMNHLTELLAHLNANDSPLSSGAGQQQQPPAAQQQHRTEILPPCGGGGGGNQSAEWSSVYQLRHGGGGGGGNSRPSLPAPSIESIPASSSTPPGGTASSSPTDSPTDYTALLLAAANYFYGGGGPVGAGNNYNYNMAAHHHHQYDPRLLQQQQQQQRSPSSMMHHHHDSPVSAEGATPEQQYSIERAARIYRKAATICDATCTWSGQLPAHLTTRALQHQCYSCKVFVGGVPWDITEQALLGAFNPFGPCRVEWPGKEARYARSAVKPSAKGKGYVYMIYESDRSVKSLLENCVRDYSHGGEYYFQLTTRRVRAKEIRQVQIIPWNVSDSNHIRCSSQRLDPKKTVFVGALHGMITAEVLCNVMNDLFNGVVYAGIDTDKYKYPIGSGRVTFNNTRSYHKAISAAFVEIKSAKFSKKVQIDPYLEDATCSNCLSAPGPYFCREFMCFRYFCKTCWHNQHALDVMQSHKPLMRNTRRTLQLQSVSSIFSNHAAAQQF